MFINLYACNGDDTLVKLLSRAQAQACTFDLTPGMAALASGQLDRLAGGVHGPMEQQCGRADPTRCCIVARLADWSNCN
eukprot:6214768-Pleurochrysis_carterae.AAC.8